MSSNSSMKKVSLTQIRKILRNCQFNPNEAGVMKVVADAGNKSYFIIRAIEALKTEPNNIEHEAQNLKQAIQLLTLAIAESENGQTKTKNQR